MKTYIVHTTGETFAIEYGNDLVTVTGVCGPLSHADQVERDPCWAFDDDADTLALWQARMDDNDDVTRIEEARDGSYDYRDDEGWPVHDETDSGGGSVGFVVLPDFGPASDLFGAELIHDDERSARIEWCIWYPQQAADVLGTHGPARDAWDTIEDAYRQQVRDFARVAGQDHGGYALNVIRWVQQDEEERHDASSMRSTGQAA